MGRPKIAAATAACPAIHTAIWSGYFRQVRFLIDMGHGVNERDSEGRTALMLCSLIESADWGAGLARTLLESGARVCYRDRRGLNALHYACVYRRPAIVALCLAGLDFDVLAADGRGQTALHYSVLVGDHVSTALLARTIRRYDLRLDKENARGVSPLALAWRSGNLLCARILLGFGAAEAAVNDAAVADGAARGRRESDGCGGGVASTAVATAGVSASTDSRRERRARSAVTESDCIAEPLTQPPQHSGNKQARRLQLSASAPSRQPTTRALSGASGRGSSRIAHLHSAGAGGSTGGRSWRDGFTAVTGDEPADVDLTLPLDVSGGGLIKSAHPHDPRNDPEYVFGLSSIEYFEKRHRQQQQQQHLLHQQRLQEERQQQRLFGELSLPTWGIGVGGRSAGGPPPPAATAASWRGEFQAVWSTYEQQCSPAFLQPAKPCPLSDAAAGRGGGGLRGRGGPAGLGGDSAPPSEYAYSRRGSRASKPPSRAALGSANDRKPSGGSSRINSRKNSVATIGSSVSQSVSRVSLLTSSESGQ